MYYVYMYFDPENHKLHENQYFSSDLDPMYVGKGLGKRYQKHLKYNKDNPLFNDRIKYLQEKNIDIPISIVFQSEIEKDVFEVEELLIELLGRRLAGTGPLYNITKGGAGGYTPSEETRKKIGIGNRGKSVSEETKIKMSVSAKGKPKSAEQKRKISESLKGNIPWNKGKTKIYSEETIEKMQNKIFSDESRKKMSLAQKGKVQTEEHKRKNSESNKGRVVSDETRRKMSEARKNYWESK